VSNERRGNDGRNAGWEARDEKHEKGQLVSKQENREEKATLDGMHETRAEKKVG
jgi:hypothetical protein